LLRTIWCAVIILPATVIMAILSMTFGVIFPKGRGYQWCARVWSWIVLWTAGVKVKVYGIENIDDKAEYVFICNHCSAFDIPVVITSIPNQIRLMAKKELAKIPFMGWSLKVGDYILVDRANRAESMKSIDEAVYKLHNGRSVLMFAEGTRSTTGEIREFKKGPFLLAIRAQVPVVPVTLNFTQNIMEKNIIRIKSGEVEIHISLPIPTTGLSEHDRDLVLQKAHEAVLKNHKL